RPGSSASPSTSEFGAFSDLPFEAGIEPRDPAPLPSPAPPKPNVEPIPAPPLPSSDPPSEAIELEDPPELLPQLSPLLLSPYPFPHGVNLESAVRLNGLAKGFFNSVEILLNSVLYSDSNPEIDDSISKVEELLRSPILTGQEHFDSYFEKIGFDVKQLFSDKISKCLKFLKDLKQKIESNSHYVGPKIKKEIILRTECLQEVLESCLELRKSIRNTIAVLSRLFEEKHAIISKSQEILVQLCQESSMELPELKERSSFISKHLEEFRKSTAKLNAYKVIREKDNPRSLEMTSILAQRQMERLEITKAMIDLRIAAREKFDIEVDRLNSKLEEIVKSAKEEIKEFLEREEARRFVELKGIEKEALCYVQDIEEHSHSCKEKALEYARFALIDYEKYDPEDMEIDFVSLEGVYGFLGARTIEILIKLSELCYALRCNLTLEEELKQFEPIFSEMEKNFSEAVELKKEFIDKCKGRQKSLSIISSEILQTEIDEKKRSLGQFIEKAKSQFGNIAERLRCLGFPDEAKKFLTLFCTNTTKEKIEIAENFEKLAVKEMEDFKRSVVERITNELKKHTEIAENFGKLAVKETEDSIKTTIHKITIDLAEHTGRVTNFRGLAVKKIKDFEEFAVREITRINNSESELMKLIFSQHESPRKIMIEHRIFVDKIFRVLGRAGYALNPWLMAIKNLLNSEEVQRSITQGADSSDELLKTKVSDELLKTLAKVSNLLEIGLGDFLRGGQEFPKELLNSDEFSHAITNYQAAILATKSLIKFLEQGANEECMRKEAMREVLRVFSEVIDKRCLKPNWERGLKRLKELSTPQTFV
ncbi:MAG: hypothetical protein LBK29_02205, partial [Oscillospiraceae bacterium]|nr:hypothetical protein [Oscillospiraceae bacterium]